MARAIYVAILAHSGDGHSVSFPDFPECTTYGDTVAEAMVNARDALKQQIRLLSRDATALPPPTLIDRLPRHDLTRHYPFEVQVDLPNVVEPETVAIQVRLPAPLARQIQVAAEDRSVWLAHAAQEKLRREAGDQL